MEIGRIPEIENAKINNIEKVKQVSGVEDKHQVIQNDEYKKKLSKSDTEELNEVILDNVKFGYNTETKDFFVKVKRGNVEHKYPTEDMMKVKAFLQEQLEEKNN